MTLPAMTLIPFLALGSRSLRRRGASRASGALCLGKTALCSYLLYTGLWVGMVMAMMASLNSGSKDRFPMCVAMSLKTLESTLLLPTACSTGFDSATALGAHSESRSQTYSRRSCISCFPLTRVIEKPKASTSSAVFLDFVFIRSSSVFVPTLADTNSPPFCVVSPAKSNSTELLATRESKVPQKAMPWPATLPSTKPMTYMGSIQNRKSICCNCSSSAGTDSSRPEQKLLPSA
mmetsp:Transcript_93304/g.216913  ORF Transcript_93304/g.216913 Transcript_93304/m.216913 type:complete len:234 (-) Transcript_93304:1171-1872(-)